MTDPKVARSAIKQPDEMIAQLERVIGAQHRIAQAQHDREKAMGAMCEEAMELTGADGAVVELAESGFMVYRSARGLGSRNIGLKVPIDRSLTGLSLKSGRILRSDDTETDSRVDREGCRRVGMRSMVVLPLQYHGRNIGVLKVLSGRAAAFGERDEKVLELMAGFLAAALAHADDYHQAQSRSLELEKALQTIREERDRRVRVSSALVHDLRTPLTTARISVELLLRGAEKGDLISSVAPRALANMERMDSMLDDILDASRIQGGQSLVLRLVECELLSLVEAAIRDLRVIHGDRFELRSEGPVSGHWDAKAIWRIVENLCQNAVKYGLPDKPIRVTVGEEGKDAVIGVHNWGPPIPPEEWSSVFEPFRRVSATRGAGQRGWGIGLTLVKGLAEAHGGSVKLESGAEKGTCFTVHLAKRADPGVTGSKEPPRANRATES